MAIARIDTMPLDAVHSGLQLFEPSQMLVNFSRSQDSEIFTQTAADGPYLEFEFAGSRNEATGNVIDPRSIALDLTIEMVQTSFNEKASSSDDDDLDPCFANNILHSLFSNVRLSLQGVEVSTANNLYPHKAYIETELSHPPECKKGLLFCQGYEYEEDPSDIVGGVAFVNRRLAVGTTRNLYGKLAVDFLGTDKYILPGVEMRLNLTRASNDFVSLAQSGATNTYAIKIKRASVHVRKLELRNATYLSIEKALLSRAACYSYTEVIEKSFAIGSGLTEFRQEAVFGKLPIVRLVVAVSTEVAFTGKSTENPFHYQKFNLNTITVQREGQAVGGTPLRVQTSDVRAYYNTLQALDIDHFGNGIPYDEFKDHYVHVFRLDADASTPTVDKIIKPELTGGELSVTLNFGTPLKKPLRVFMYGEKISNIYISSNREVLKNATFLHG